MNWNDSMQLFCIIYLSYNVMQLDLFKLKKMWPLQMNTQIKVENSYQQLFSNLENKINTFFASKLERALHLTLAASHANSLFEYRDKSSFFSLFFQMVGKNLQANSHIYFSILEDYHKSTSYIYIYYIYIYTAM